MRRSLLVMVIVGLTACDDVGSVPDAAAEVDAGPPPPPVALGVYSELLPYPDVEATLPALAARGAALQVAVPNDRIGDAELASLLTAAESEGVEVRLWLVLPIADGYWPNEDNLATFADEVMRLLDWVDAEGLTAHAVVYDLEPAFEYSEALREAFATASLDGIQALMATHVDPARFEASRAALAAHVEAVQARGVRAEAVTYPQVVDDMDDGDADLQDALDIPVDGVPFDDVAFMVYQTSFAEAQGEWIGPGLVRSYAEDARTHFGDRATIALGIVGSASILDHDGPLYESPAVLAADIGAARAAGIERVEVYSLDGMVELGLDAWLAGTVAPPSPVAIDPAARIVRGAASGLDGALDEGP